MSTIPQMLSRVDLFAGLPAHVHEELISRGTKMRCPPGHTLVTQGAEDAGFQLLLEGEATVLVHGVEVRTLVEGDYFGEISLIDGAPRSATVISAAAGCTTFTISPLSFWPIVDTHPEMARSLLMALTARLRSLESAQLGPTAD